MRLTLESKLSGLVQKSRNWGERASKGFGFTLTNMKRKSTDSSAEAVTFSLNFRCLAEPAEQVSHMDYCITDLCLPDV